MNLIRFSEQYPDEQSCKSKIKEVRDKAGVICAKCGGIEHYWKRDKEMYECFSHLLEEWYGYAQVTASLPLLAYGVSFDNGDQKRIFDQRDSTPVETQALSADLVYGTQNPGVYGCT